MAKITFQRKDIEKHISLSQDMLDRINMFGTTVESVTENKLELEIHANRPDLFSTSGFLRAFLAFIGKEKGMRKYDINLKLKKEYEIQVNKNIVSIRPYVGCCVVRNIQLSEDRLQELVSLQERLHASVGRNRKKCAIGVYPLDKITFPIKFEAKKAQDIQFRPLGQEKEMNAKMIMEKTPIGKEYGHLLAKHSLYPIFIDAKKKVLSMPPIINSEDVGRVTSQTKNIFIECSGTSKESVKKALIVMSLACADMDGELYGTTIKHTAIETTPELVPEKMTLDFTQVRKIIGLDLSEKQIKEALTKMCYEIQGKNLVVPPWRFDVMHSVDVIEDIAIGHGYDKLIPEESAVSGIGEESGQSIVNKKVLDALIGLGFLETSSLHLVTENEAELMSVKKPLIVENARTEYKIARPSLIIPTLRTLSENTHIEYPQKICEIGTVFADDPEENNGIKESAHLVAAVSPGNYTAIKQILEYLSDMFQLPKPTIAESKHEGFIDGRCCSISINGTVIGYMGELHPTMLQKWNIKMPVAALELDMQAFYKK